ncbi:unnamed protein product [Protopolystoma xenopodis]|uniref:Uncharacterized protein n=1 Tax=Protopolystoma xenopodis TaxID=117903 RepID=A0A3S5ASN3_9PLAT|nr:unnamed protein product [Protopolystoma xenopodis]
MGAVAETFKGYQYYEFAMLKDLASESRRLAASTAAKCDRQLASEATAPLSDEDEVGPNTDNPSGPQRQIDSENNREAASKK